MQKNALQPLALTFIVVVLALCLEPSVAQLRSAASVAAVISSQRTMPLQRAPTRSSNPPVIVRDTLRTKSHLDLLLDQSGINAHQRPLASAVLGLLTPACQEKLRTFSVLYDNPQHRGLAGRGVIIVSGIVPDQEFIGLLLHEGLGHFRDITCLTGNPSTGASAFHDGQDQIWNDDPSVAFYRISWQNEKKRKARAQRRDFVTGYAYQADNFEDLAESLTYYLTQEQSFRTRAKTDPILAEKLTWLETYMPKNGAVAEGNAWDGQIAWDATKLEFTWLHNLQLAAVK